jgi:hypothetical protein
MAKNQDKEEICKTMTELFLRDLHSALMFYKENMRDVSYMVFRKNRYEEILEITGIKDKDEIIKLYQLKYPDEKPFEIRISEP